MKFLNTLLNLFLLITFANSQSLPEIKFRCFNENPKSDSSTTYEEQDGYAGRSYYCDTFGNFRKFIRVNVHWVSTDSGTGNFRATDDGNGNPFVTGYTKAEEMINMANSQLLNHPSMWLPNPNNTPRFPVGIGLVLNGVFFDKSTQARNAATTDFTFNTTLGKEGANTINVYMLENPTYNGGGIACNFGLSVGMYCVQSPALKIYGTWHIYNTVNPDWTTFKSRLLLHELGHLLNSYHSWQYDYCGDTPENNNCWSFNPSSPNCDTWAEVTNNIMDYSGYDQAAWSPCQIGRVTSMITGSIGDDFIYNCSDCVPAIANFTIGGNFCGTPPIPMDCRGTFNENNYFIEIYKTTSYTGTYVVPGTYFSSWYSGQAPLINDLKTIYTPGFYSGLYRIKLAAQNFRPDNTYCNPWDEEVKYFTICASDGGGSGKTDSLDFLLETSSVEFLSNVSINPNPSVGNFTINFTPDEQLETTIIVSDLSGRAISENTISKGVQTYNFEINSLGTFLVTLKQQHLSVTRKVIVIK